MKGRGVKALISALVLAGCSSDTPAVGKGREVALEGNGVVAQQSSVHDDKLSPAPQRSTPQPLKEIDELDARALRNFLAGKRLTPSGLIGGTEILETNGSWRAAVEAVALVSLEGSWEIRRGRKDKPELCTTTYKRNGRPSHTPGTTCRTIAVSIHKNRAELSDASLAERKYLATISAIEY